WSRTTNLFLIVTAVLYLWNTGHAARIAMVASLLFMFATAVGYLYFYYRDEASRKPLFVATQITFSRILLSPFFIWVFFSSSDPPPKRCSPCGRCVQSSRERGSSASGTRACE